jgi:hypothetical protein
MNYFDEAENFANESYSNYGGNEWDNFQDEYNYANGGGQEALASLPFVINIANSTTVDVASVVILSANLGGTAPNFNNDVAITITMDNGDVTYAEFLQDIKSSPFKVGMMYLQSANTSQPFKALTITHRESNGRKVTLPVNPALDPMQQQSTVSIVKAQFPVNAYTSITTTILASATLIMRLYPSEQLDIARTLSGQTVSKDYSRPNLSQAQSNSRGGLIG